MTKTGPCTVVDSGGVGESGASSLVHHKVKGDIAKNIVIRTEETSLCPNTGVVAILVVDGQTAAHGVITDKGATIQAEAKPGDRVFAIAHTIPLFNEIACVRLGELRFTVEVCDFV